MSDPKKEVRTWLLCLQCGRFGQEGMNHPCICNEHVWVPAGANNLPHEQFVKRHHITVEAPSNQIRAVSNALRAKHLANHPDAPRPSIGEILKRFPDSDGDDHHNKTIICRFKGSINDFRQRFPSWPKTIE